MTRAEFSKIYATIKKYLTKNERTALSNEIKLSNDINVLFPDVLDRSFVFAFNPETTVSFPVEYRFLIRELETGSLITPDDVDTHWNKIVVEDGSPVDTNSDLTSGIDIEILLSRSNRTGGVFLLLAYQYDTLSDKLLEREQSQYMIIIENGLKSPSLA